MSDQDRKDDKRAACYDAFIGGWLLGADMEELHALGVDMANNLHPKRLETLQAGIRDHIRQIAEHQGEET